MGTAGGSVGLEEDLLTHLEENLGNFRLSLNSVPGKIMQAFA